MVKIVRVWQHQNEPDKVHYVAEDQGGRRRHLWQAVDSTWGRMLLASIGGH